jgi:DNA-binding LacI/PurR family transcriptional regulator
MTVSRAINGSGYVSAEARERVEKAIRELDYSPNALARSLKRQKTQVVGILLADVANPFSSELSRSIETVLVSHGYSCFISTTQSSTEREVRAMTAFFDHRVDGIVIATRETGAGNEALTRLIARGLPVVVVGRNCGNPGVDRVTADHWKGGFDTVSHLISLGHHRIAFLGASLINGSGLPRYQGYLDALREHGIELREEYVVGPEGFTPAYATQADGYEGLKRLLALDRPPTAVFARNDYTAIGALCAAHDLDMRVPDDIAVAGFDNIGLAAYTTPPLTTVDQCISDQGRRAAVLLLDRMEGGYTGPRREVILECRLITRQSTSLQLTEAGATA